MISLSVNMLQSLKPFLCPHCNLSYSSKEVTKYNVARFPRILTCSHSVCENCLHDSAKNDKFTCPSCKEEIDLSVDINGSSELLPDVHALGIISANMRNSLPSLKLTGHSNYSYRNKSQESLKKSVSTIVCGRCHKNNAQWQCDECQLNFCSVCFGDVHRDIKTRKPHEGKKIFAELYNSTVQEGCIEHENKAVEFYCEVDNTLTCSYCMLMGDHVGHEVKTLLDKNKACAEDLRNVLDDVSRMQRQLKYTDHLLYEAIPKEKIDVSHFVKEIHDYFHHLHALLQMRELELINEITNMSESSIIPLEEMRLKITGLERDLAAGKKDAESVIDNPCLAISAPELLKKLQDSKNLPCYLVPVDNHEDLKFLQIDLDLKSELEDQIKNFGQLRCNVKHKFELKAESELPETFTPPKIPENFDIMPQDLDAESCATSVDNFSEDSLSTTNDKFSSSQATYKCKEFTKMQPEKVSVSHIKSPLSFFVQKFSDNRKLSNLSEAVNKYCKHDGKRNIPTEINLGDLYLVKYSADKRWYRGRAIAILDSECETNGDVPVGKVVPMLTEEGRVIAKPKEIYVKVFYIDFGNSEIVSLHNMRNILPRFLNLPGLAKECSLVDIKPVNETKWSEECMMSFNKFVRNKLVIMQIYEERNNILYVDLSQIPDNDISFDMPVSVRDALVFLELAVFPSGVKALPPGKRNKYRRSYLPPESLKVNANVWAIVSHVNDPYDFYIQQMSTASYLSNLIFEMNETYNNDLKEILHNIYVPYVGMMCAAQFSLDKQWYRAEVIGLPGGAKVEVRYVDFGNSEIIHHKYLRKLYDRFTKLNIQAIPCKLAHVSYNQEKCWSSQAKKWLTNEVSRKQLTIKSLGTIPGSNKSEVVLYYTEEEYDICVNSLMVQNELATSTGPFGSTEVKIKKEASPKRDQNKTISAADMKKTFRDVIPPPVPKQNNLKFVQPVISLGATESNNSSHEVETPKSLPKKYPSLVSSDSDKIAGSLEIHVSHIESPGCFYIHASQDDRKKLNLLMQELQKTYENMKGEIIECSIGKAYAVYSRNQKKWFRGSVLSKISDDKFKIRFVDYGNSEEIQSKDICKLDDKFTEDDAFCVRCHLDGIIPTGGSAQWPQTSCDAFKRAVNQYEKLLLSCKGEVDQINSSLPADLFVENLIKGGALEPFKLEFLSISEQLVKSGLALPLRRRCGGPSGLQMKTILEPKKENLISTEKVEDVCNNEKERESQIENIKVENNINVKTDKNHDIKEEIKITKEKNVLDVKDEKCSLEIKEEIKSNKLVNGEINIKETNHSSSQKLKIKSPLPAKPKFQWKPAVLPQDTSFRAFVTNIGEDGSIFLQVLNEGSNQVDVIKRALQFKFSRNMYEPLKEVPLVGEACIAKFSVDDMWYRAEVISTYYNQVKVNFVDYGNNEIVALKDIRPEVIMQNFPRQCVECTLFGVKDKIKWDNDLTTFLHNQLVETDVTVDVKGPLEHGCLPCEIKMLSGIDVGELLLSLGCDASSEDLDELSASQTNSDSFKTFSTSREWEEGEMFPVCITQVPSPNIVYLQQLKIPTPKNDYEVKHNKRCEAFLQLITELREKADSFPKLEDPLPGMPCCAKYSYDQNWYRCEVTDLTENGVVVLYVDYGNTETVSAEDLKELESSFIDFPVQLYFCQLHGVKPAEEEWNPVVHDLLIKKFLVPDQDFIAKVVVPGKISQIDLIAEIDGEYKLVYEDLANDNLIILDKCGDDQ